MRQTERFPRRSWLFVPAHSERMVTRSLDCDADVVIFDLEDAVPLGRKSVARELLSGVLTGGSPGTGPERFVRINAHATYRDLHPDLEAVVRVGLRGLVVPKVASPESLRFLSACLDVWESLRGLPSGTLELVPLLESPGGVLDAREIAAATSRTSALAFGAEDFTEAMRLPPTATGVLDAARSAVSMAASAAGVPSIDRVWTDLADTHGMSQDAQAARDFGFSGKLAIHPSQVPSIHAAFRPSAEEVEAAAATVAAFADAQRRGESVAVVNGRMVDAPVARKAEHLLHLHDASTQEGGVLD